MQNGPSETHPSNPLKVGALGPVGTRKLQRPSNLDIQLGRRPKDKLGLTKELPGNQDQIRQRLLSMLLINLHLTVILLDDTTSHLGSGDQPDSANEQVLALGLKSLPDLAGDADLVVGVQLDLLVDVVAARADVEEIDAQFGEQLGQTDGLRDTPALAGVFHPFRGRDAEEEGHGFWHDGAGGLDHLDQEPGAVLEGAAVLVCPLLFLLLASCC
jgi:hypothetical protein